MGKSIGESGMQTRRHRFAWLLAALILGSIAAQMSHAASAAQPSSSPGKLPKVTIQAAKVRKALRLQVDRFVSSLVVQTLNESLLRWNTPVCPLVAGLPKAFGEFILGRISKAAADANAPLAGSVCHPNLYIVASDSPDQLVEKWARDGMLTDTRAGFAPIAAFVHSRLPIRVWYNTGMGCSGGTPLARGVKPTTAAFDSGKPGMIPPACRGVGGGSVDTHLSYAALQSISAAIVVIDLRQLKHVTIQQLADYTALVGLADIRLDADPGATPSILQLFGHASPPQSLSPWDQALLYSLYHTRQAAKLQMSQVESTMVARIAPQ